MNLKSFIQILVYISFITFTLFGVQSFSNTSKNESSLSLNETLTKNVTNSSTSFNIKPSLSKNDIFTEPTINPIISSDVDLNVSSFKYYNLSSFDDITLSNISECDAMTVIQLESLIQLNKSKDLNDLCTNSIPSNILNYLSLPLLNEFSYHKKNLILSKWSELSIEVLAQLPFVSSNILPLTEYSHYCKLFQPSYFGHVTTLHLVSRDCVDSIFQPDHCNRLKLDFFQSGSYPLIQSASGRNEAFAFNLTQPMIQAHNNTLQFILSNLSPSCFAQMDNATRTDLWLNYHDQLNPTIQKHFAKVMPNLDTDESSSNLGSGPIFPKSIPDPSSDVSFFYDHSYSFIIKVICTCATISILSMV